MGFEIKLIIGESGLLKSPEIKQSKRAKIDGDYVYFPFLKDKNGKFIETGRIEHTFLNIAEIDLCKPGAGAVNNLYEKYSYKGENKDVHKWFRDPNTKIEEDCYGKKKIPVPIPEVIEALEEDNKTFGEYHRFTWAIALLKAIEKSRPNGYSVIMFGY